MYQPGSWGISKVSDLLDTGVLLGVIQKSGNTHSFNGQKIGVGKEAVKNAIQSDSNLLEEIEKSVREAAKNAKTPPAQTHEDEDEDGEDEEE
jgi:recombination protein RecA